jgi:hypothetical protein
MCKRLWRHTRSCVASTQSSKLRTRRLSPSVLHCRRSWTWYSRHGKKRRQKKETQGGETKGLKKRKSRKKKLDTSISEDQFIAACVKLDTMTALDVFIGARITQSCLESLFSHVCQLGGGVNNPTESAYSGAIASIRIMNKEFIGGAVVTDPVARRNRLKMYLELLWAQ